MILNAYEQLNGCWNLSIVIDEYDSSKILTLLTKHTIEFVGLNELLSDCTRERESESKKMKLALKLHFRYSAKQ